jgi:predicted dehydrogenase
MISVARTPGVSALRAAVIGAGRRGAAHARAALASGAAIASVCDPDPERARRLAGESGARVVSGLDAALAEEPDLAFITSPPPLHAAQTLAALRAGCHVILEKPIALTMREALEIGRVSATTGRAVHVCQQHRYSQAAARAREALAGRRVALVHIWLYRPAPDIRGNWDRAWGGGHVVEWAIHPIDLCRHVLGDVDTVYAAYTEQVLAGAEGWNNWDGYACTFRFASGAVGSVATTYAAWPGSGGGFALDIVAEGMIVRWRSSGLEIERPHERVTYPEPVEPTVSLHRAVYRWMQDGSALPIDYAGAARTLATVLACNHSNETGHPVRVAEFEAREDS